MKRFDGLKKMALALCAVTTAVYANWKEVAKVVGDPQSAVEFGYSIDFDGRYAAVGDPGENAVYVFKLDANGSWKSFSKISDPRVGTVEFFRFNRIGTDVAIDDHMDEHDRDVVLAIGSAEVNHYVLRYENGKWVSKKVGEDSGVLVYRLNADRDGFDLNTTFTTVDYNTSGRAIALDSYSVAEVINYQIIWHTTEVLAVGKPREGKVTLHYYSDQMDWNQTDVVPTLGDGSGFGESVALWIADEDKAYLAVGAPEENVTKNGYNYEGKGAAYLFKLVHNDDPNGPPLIATHEYRVHQDIPDFTKGAIVEDSAFGIAVDLENNTTFNPTLRLIVGAKKENIVPKDIDGNAIIDEGEAYVFKMSTPPPTWHWLQVGNPLKGSTVSYVNDGYGLHVAVKGNVAVVSAPNIEWGKGAVYVYDYNGSRWVQRPVLQPVDADGFGSDVSIVGATVVAGNKNKKEVSSFAYKSENFLALPGVLLYLFQ